MSTRNRQAPSNWDAYDRGRAGSVESLGSITEDGGPTEYMGSPSTPPFASRMRGIDAQLNTDQSLRNRRPSQIFNSIRQMGGVNNLDNFVSSFQRAAGFHEITPVRRGSVSFGKSEDEEAQNAAQGSTPNKSLLRQQFENAGTPPQGESQAQAHTQTPVHPDASDTTPLLQTSTNITGRSQRAYSIRSYLGADGMPSLGSSYGSISRRLNPVAQQRASILIQRQYEASLRALEGEGVLKDDALDPTERQVEIETREDGEVIERIVGESTVPMTIFNSTNVLIGVGILALPLAVRYSGWIIGLSFLTFAAIVTNYTALLLAKCLDTNSGSTTYGDIAFLAFGDIGRAIVELLFVVELTAANVALVILFGDSMNLIIPTVGTKIWKAGLALGLIPLNFVPFKYLSVTSILGIVCCMGIILIVFVDGLIKPHTPGSIRHVAKTYPFPADWRTIPLSIGLFLAPWGGHSVFPAVYKDMRHPYKYPRALRTTYIFTYGLDLTMAVLGYLMFGERVRDEITSNILDSKSYPQVLSLIMVVLIAVIPVTKVPLSNRPIMDTLNKKFLIDLRQMTPKAREYSEKSIKHRGGRAAVAISCNIVQLGIAILVPDFDSIMALMGSALCLTICIILPVVFYLKLFSSEGKEISRKEKILDYVLVAFSASLAIIGTVCAILPKSKIGLESCQGLLCMG